MHTAKTHPKCRCHCQFIACAHTHALTDTLSLYRDLSLTPARILTLSLTHSSGSSSHQCLQSAIAPVLLPFLFWLLRVPRLRLQLPCARAPIGLLSFPCPRCDPALLVFGTASVYYLAAVVRRSQGFDLYLYFVGPLCPLLSVTAPVPPLPPPSSLPQGNKNRYRCRLVRARARFHTMFIIIRLLLSYTFEGWLSFYWVSRAFCYPIILR